MAQRELLAGRGRGQVERSFPRGCGKEAAGPLGVPEVGGDCRSEKDGGRETREGIVSACVVTI